MSLWVVEITERRSVEADCRAQAERIALAHAKPAHVIELFSVDSWEVEQEVSEP